MPILRSCAKCAAPFDPAKAKWPKRYCPAHELTREQRSPSSRAQDGEYRRNRKIVLVGNPPCALCGEPSADTVDHITPVSAGGTNALTNLQPAHAWCNGSKGGGVAPDTHAAPSPPPRKAPVGGRLH